MSSDHSETSSTQTLNLTQTYLKPRSFEPRPYQLEGIQFLRTHKRAMLTDDPGLGKTLQAACASTPPCVIFAPTYWVEGWAEFLRDQFPYCSIEVCSGTFAQRQASINKKADFTICNIEMARKRTICEEEVVHTKWGGDYTTVIKKQVAKYTWAEYTTVIVDESHRIRNRESNQAKAIKEIADGAEFVFLLTGTPIYREPDDLYMQLHVCRPQIFISYWKFVQDYCNTKGSYFAVKVTGARNIDRLKKLLQEFMLGRTYKEVGMYLPDMIEQKVIVKMPPEVVTLYNRIKATYEIEELEMDIASQMEAMQTLRYVTAEMKKTIVQQIVEDLNGQGVLVYSWYKHSAEDLAEELGGTLITGDVHYSERAKVAREGGAIICGTIGSLSEGVDLSHLRAVVFFEEDWTPGSMYQALSRVRRFSKTGEREPVLVYYVMCEGTIDVHIHNVVGSRDVTIKQILRKALK